MKLFRAEEMRAIDEAAMRVGMPVQLLMEAAGRAVADSATRNFPDRRRPLVLCGKGNNGGDGYVAARYLHLMGRVVGVLELASELPAGAAATARQACLAHLPVDPLDAATLERALAECDLVVDALFGSGLTRALTGAPARFVELINDSGLPVLSVDVPSGVGADAPLPPGPHVRATRTVQLAGAKLSSALYPARAAYGEQEIADIGIPAAVLAGHSGVRLLDSGASGGIPSRSRDSHKYQVGTVLVLAGSPRYLGAAELACRGAYRAGAGLVTLAAEGRLPASWPEIVFAHLAWTDRPALELGQIDERRAQAIVAGPGLDERALVALPDLIRARPVPWVLDAGALAPDLELTEAVREHGRCVLTPHAGEAAKLLGTDSSAIRNDPIAAAAEIAENWNAVCVLKGGTTVIAGGGDPPAVSARGHPGMASGGSGDVLAGVLGAFLAAGGEMRELVEAAVDVHGRAGELAGSAAGNGLIASDLVEWLPAALDGPGPGGS